MFATEALDVSRYIENASAGLCLCYDIALSYAHMVNLFPSKMARDYSEPFYFAQTKNTSDYEMIFWGLKH